MERIRVLLVDDHEIVRQGIRTFLELQGDFEVAGEGANGVEAVALAEELKPDIVLLDLVMPEMDGVEATRRILLTNPDCKIVILTSFSDDDDALPAIRAGAMGYLLKNIPPDELANALRATYQGQTQLHPDITEKLIHHFQNPQETSSPSSLQVKDLTDRELEVLQLIGQGFSNREIGNALSISHKTVKTHVSNLLSKLHLSDRTQAAIFAIKEGIVPNE